MGSSIYWVNPKTIKLVFVTFPLKKIMISNDFKVGYIVYTCTLKHRIGK